MIKPSSRPIVSWLASTHPDVNPGNKAAEQFKAINEANQVLSDAKQRKKYDELRAQYQQWQQKGGRKQDFDWQNWSASGAGTGTAGASQPGQAAGVQYANPEDMEDMFGSDSPYSDFFANLFGRGKSRGAPPGPRRGRDVEYEVDLPWKRLFMV